MVHEQSVVVRSTHRKSDEHPEKVGDNTRRWPKISGIGFPLFINQKFRE